MALQKLTQRASKGRGSKGTTKSLLRGTRSVRSSRPDNTAPRRARSGARMTAGGIGHIR